MSDLIGMDPAAVSALADRITGQATALQGVIGTVDGIVYQISESWQGPVATEFAGWWYRQHKPALLKATAAISGLATSAHNNTKQQDQASAGATTGTGPAATTAGAVVVGAGAGSVAASRVAQGASAVGGSAGAASAATAVGAGSAFGSAVAQTAISAAKQYEGDPTSANGTDFVAKNVPNSAAWCAEFASWSIAQQLGGKLPATLPDGTTMDWVSAKAWLAAAQSNKFGLSVVPSEQQVRPGDFAIYNGGSHIAVVTSKVDGNGQFQSVQGNFNLWVDDKPTTAYGLYYVAPESSTGQSPSSYYGTREYDLPTSYSEASGGGAAGSVTFVRYTP